MKSDPSPRAQGALAALARAAQRARERALATNTPLVQWSDGKVQLVTVQAPNTASAK
ncbi:MAG: hypothetical protein V4650_02120 [Pseudomonadota bacterium]